MKTKKRIIGYFKVLSLIAAAFLIFTIALNTVPAFADSVRRLPGGETVVRLLTFFGDTTVGDETIGRLLPFVGDTATGGEITDGQDIKEIQVEKPLKEPGKTTNEKDYFETLSIELYQGADPAAVAGHFTVTRKTHPYSIEVALAGVRAFSAARNLPDLSKMKLFGTIYKIVTLDDSANRFVVTFKKPVSIEVSEHQNPARLIIEVRKDKEAEMATPMYSLRTSSLPFGEVVGIAENIMKFELGSLNARLLMDDSGLFLAEEGLYATKPEAVARMATLKQYEHFLYDMHIEKRKPGSIPGTIAE